MRKTKIEWCDTTWNPVSGCYHNCKYCYASRIARRFGGASNYEIDASGEIIESMLMQESARVHVLDEPITVNHFGKKTKAAYPYYFEPTLFRYRLTEPSQLEKPRSIFVCSMGDLFGDWVPEKWILSVFDACLAVPQHRYLFLTKNPSRYVELASEGKLPREDNFWYGSTADNPSAPVFAADGLNTFMCIEPITQPFGASNSDFLVDWIDWVIFGAETGRRNGKVVPERSWIEAAVEQFQLAGKPIFMKDSMKPVWGDGIICQFPWDVDGQEDE